MHRTSYSKREEFELRLVRSPIKRCGALKAPAEGVFPPFAKFCPEREAGPSCGDQKAGASSCSRKGVRPLWGAVGFLILRGRAELPHPRGQSPPPQPAQRAREERRGGLVGPALPPGRPTTRLPRPPGRGVSEGRGRNTAGVPAPRETCAKWEAGHSGEAWAQQDRSVHACPLPGFVSDCEPSLFPR